jgi:hypothetical protein
MQAIENMLDQDLGNKNFCLLDQGIRALTMSITSGTIDVKFHAVL